MPLRQLALVGTLAALLSSCGLNSIRTKTLLTMVNTNTPQEPHFDPPRKEIADFVRIDLPDAYWNPACPNALMDPAQAVGPLAQALACASHAQGIDAEDACFHQLFDALHLPRTPPPEARSAPAWAREQDVTRLETNLKQVIRDVVAHYVTAHLKSVDANDPEIRAGLADGLAAFRDYQNNRQVARDRSRPVSAFVMSGGAAKGAYSAGAVWWLLSRLDACRTEAELRIAHACGRDPACIERLKAAPENACLGDKVDMVAGTSTGSMITLLVKDYFDPGQNRRRRALDKLVTSYTCSVNSDLYCVVDAGLGDLGLDDDGKARGVVRFDGIAKSLDEYVDQRMLQTPTEYFASTVEFQSGNTYHLSSADRREVPDVDALKQSALASIVEPILAEPQANVGHLRGTLVDGGVRSGLPLSTPLARGAERAVVFVNGPLEPTPLNTPPQNALNIGMRMIDLFAYQPIVGELHEAEYRVSVKRSLEYERCLERLASPPASPQDTVPRACLYDNVPARALAVPLVMRAEPPASHLGEHMSAAQDVEMHQLCAGEVWPSDGRSTSSGAQSGPEALTAFPHEVSRTYRSTWLFEPHELPAALTGSQSVEPGLTLQSLSAVGYEFDPKAMWQMFVLGAAVAQQRCPQLDDTLGWHLGGWCGTVDNLRDSLAPLRKRAQERCWTKDTKQLRDCPK